MSDVNQKDFLIVGRESSSGKRMVGVVMADEECFLWGHQVMGQTHRDSSSFHAGFSSRLPLILGVGRKPERSLVKSDVFF